jgi:hypothetical protein
MNFSVLDKQSIATQGKQSLGYLGVLSKTPDYPFKAYCYVGQDMHNGQSRHFLLDDSVYKQLVDEVKNTALEDHEYFYLWALSDDHGHLLQHKLFKLPMPLHDFNVIYQHCYNVEHLLLLVQFGHSIKNASLKTFFWKLFTNVELMKKFVSIPASREHHHSFPGGLLAHSLECMMIVYRNLKSMNIVSQNEVEVTAVSALLHDIGKTETINQIGHTLTGFMLNHEQLTLSIIAEALAGLNQTWHQGALTLQYLLTWQRKDKFSRYVGGNLIKMADQLSTRGSLHEMAFVDKPEYFSFATLETSNAQHKINRLI